jgi:Kef-type K+ transport system membrane component KefB
MDYTNSMVFTMFLIFTGAALLSTLALYTRQSLLVAYIILGALLGPWGLGLIADPQLIEKTGDFGIIFLLFLLGLHLQPRNLLHMFRRAILITLASSVIFAIVGFVIAYFFGFNPSESLLIGAAMMFSSTIIGLKLLPTTVLHHQHIGEIVISVLLLQDLIAIFLLFIMHAVTVGVLDLTKLGLVLLSLPVLLVFTFVFEYFVLRKMFARFDRVREYIFLLAIAWCLSISVLAKLTGLSYEIGAFIAGVSIAEGPIALYIAESLKPVRDFFLVLFFFSVGASFNLHYLKEVAIPAVILAVALLLIKPVTFWILLRQIQESRHVAWEVGWRLGQMSEFSLLVASVGLSSALIGAPASYLIQATTILTFIVSPYIVVLRYPTPVALSERLRRD